MKTLITLLTFSLLAVSTMKATVWRVNNNPNYVQGNGGPCGEADVCAHCFTQLQSAIDCSSVLFGDTIYVEASGDSYGNVIIDKQLTIIGTGYLLGENPDLQCSNQTSIVNYVNFNDGSDGSTIIGLTIRLTGSTNNGYVNLNGGRTNITIDRCYIRRSVRFNTSSVVYNDISITRSIISSSISESGSTSSEDVFGVRIENNIIYGSIDFSDDVNVTGVIQHNVIGNNVSIHAGVTFMNNLCTADPISFPEYSNNTNNVHHNAFAGSGFSYLTDPSNHFDLGQSYMFSNFGDTENIETVFEPGPSCTECLLGTESDCAATNEMGIYGGCEPYIRAGIPTIPTVYEKSNTSTAFPEGTVNATISAKAHN